MFWVIHHRNGVALAEAKSRDGALKWCETQLGRAYGPFAVTPAIQADLEDFGVELAMGAPSSDLVDHIYNDTDEFITPLQDAVGQATWQ